MPVQSPITQLAAAMGALEKNEAANAELRTDWRVGQTTAQASTAFCFSQLHSQLNIHKLNLTGGHTHTWVACFH